MILEMLSHLVFGSQGGLKLHTLRDITRRTRFSDFLPWLAFDPETQVYLNSDDTVGFIWECTPLCFAGSKQVDSIRGLLRVNLPEGSVMQFILHADKDILPFMESYKSLKTRNNPLIDAAAKSFTRYLIEGTRGLNQLQGIPVRNHRLFVTVKIPLDSKESKGLDMAEAQSTIEEILTGASLCPCIVTPDKLIFWLRRFFNDYSSPNDSNYDDLVPIRSQILLSETSVKKNWSQLEVGEKIFRCITPKSFPSEVDPLSTNQLFGGIWGMISDSDQITAPYLYTLNIIFEDMKKVLHAKCNLILQQQGIGSFAPSLNRKKEEYLRATDQLEKGTHFLKILPVIWVWGGSEKQVSNALSRVRRIWESQSYVMQTDKGILPVLFISSLPFGLYNKANNINNLDRDFITPSDTVSAIMPLQTDFSGGGKPYLIFIGRKGQLCSLDIFDPAATNHNIFVAAGTGSGKSFFVNSLVYNHYASGDLIRIIDIGGSYKKMARMFGGRYLDFEGNDICLNPFSHIIDMKFDIPVIASIVEQMACSSSDTVHLSETERTLIKNAVLWAWETSKEEAGIDSVHEYLESFPRHATELDFDCGDKEDCTRDIKQSAHTLAYNISKFTTGKMYGSIFNGRANFDIAHDELLVLELEHLKPRPDLFKVIVMQIINAITNDLYLSDRSQRRFIILDEAWQFLSGAETLKRVIEEGYRRARKYGGSITIVTQSILDLKQFGNVGEVIHANSAFKFYLQSEDFDKAQSEQLLDADDFTMKLLKTVQTSPGKYSELFMKTPFGTGIARLVVDPYSYFVYTSRASEIAEIEKLVQSGMGYKEAIEVMVERKHSH
jgi:conjugal transfer ATP-binding protein TraC